MIGVKLFIMMEVLSIGVDFPLYIIPAHVLFGLEYGVEEDIIRIELGLIQY